MTSTKRRDGIADVEDRQQDALLEDVHAEYEVIIFWSEENQVFIAEVPELSGCAAHGDSPESALASCEEAAEFWLDTAKEFGRPIPELRGRRIQLA